MIVLKAGATLSAVFHKTIKVMEQNVEWNETFIINNNTLILPGTLKSLFFSFDNKKVIGTVMEKEIHEEPRLMLDNKMLENAVNMVLYIFGKWGKIKGLTVEKDYKQLDSLMNSILQEIDVQAAISQNHCHFYKDNVQITYEEVIELILEYMKPDYLAAQEEQEDSEELKSVSDWEEKYKLGLWHKIVWKSYAMGFSKKDVSVEEKKKSRIGKDFYITGYQCPECKSLLYMVVYPESKEFRIETDEGRVVLARAYTCCSCHRFYTPKPYKLLLEGSIYMMDFEEDENAYEDYLELLGQNGERTSNSNYNMYENAFLNRQGMDETDDGSRLAELYANMPEMSDEEIFDIADMFDSGFYSSGEKEKYEDTVEKELKRRGISRNIPPEKKKEKSQKKYSIETEDTADTEYLTQTERKEKQELHSETSARESAADVISPKVKRAKEYAQAGDETAFNSLLDTFTEEELKQAHRTLEYNEAEQEQAKGHYEPYLKQVSAKLLKKQQTDVLNTALSVKGKSYVEMKQAYHTILKKDCPDSVKENVLASLKNWMQQRGEKELQVLLQHVPENHTRKMYQQFKEKFQEYNDIDNARYIKALDEKRDSIEQKELEAFVKKNNKRPKDRKSLLALADSIKSLDYEERNKKIYTDRLLEQVAAIDQAAINRICPNVFELTYEEGLEAYKKISEGNFLPELKVDYLNRITKRLEAMKKDECRNLVNKFIRDTDWKEGSVEGIYLYDIRRMSNENCEDVDAIIVQNAVNTYAGGERFEYPLLVYDATRGGNGKKGFVLTPDHIYYNSSMTAGTIKIAEIEEFYMENGLFNKGIYIRNTRKEAVKISGTIKADKGVLENFLKKLNQFLKYLKEKPESRSIEYLAQEKHDVKCCYRCGYVYKYGNVCPKCGSRNNV